MRGYLVGAIVVGMIAVVNLGNANARETSPDIDILLRTGRLLPEDADLTRTLEWVRHAGTNEPVPKESCDRLLVVECGASGVTSKTMTAKELDVPVDVRHEFHCLSDKQSTVLISWTQGRDSKAFVLQPVRLSSGQLYMAVMSIMNIGDDGVSITSKIGSADKNLLNDELAYWAHRAPATP